jgi:hypothetical protein
VKIRSVFLSTVVLGLVAGCAKQEASKGLQGRWRAHCVEGASAALLGQADLGVTQTAALSIGEKSVGEVSYIGGAKCSEKDIRVNAGGTYTSSTGSTGIPNSIDVDKISYKVKPLTEFGVRVLNVAKWCGVTNWMIGEERDVTVDAGKAKCFSSRSSHTTIGLDGDRLKITESDRIRTSTFGVKEGLYFERR